MKILTGRLKGRSLNFHPKEGLRPTADKVRKAFVDILREFIPEARVLDLYSGTGAMGFEALSNDAARVQFVEVNKEDSRAIEQMAKRWELSDKISVLTMDVFRAIIRLGAQDEKYDLVLMDPPYGDSAGVPTLRAIEEAGILEKGGFVVAEAGKREDFPESVGSLRVLRDKRYGQSRMLIYQKA